MDYVPYMKHLMTAPLVNDGSSGVDQTVSLLHAYDLLREDFDNVLEVSAWSSTPDVMSSVDSKVRNCYLTRMCGRLFHCSFSAVTLLAGQQEVCPACKYLVVAVPKGFSLKDLWETWSDLEIVQLNESWKWQ